MSTQPIRTGSISVTAHCPGCDQPVALPANLIAVLKLKDTGESTIGLSLTAKQMPHNCHTEQQELFAAEPTHVDPDTGEILIDPDCRDGKHRSCIGGPCRCDCHTAAA